MESRTPSTSTTTTVYQHTPFPTSTNKSLGLRTGEAISRATYTSGTTSISASTSARRSIQQPNPLQTTSILPTLLPPQSDNAQSDASLHFPHPPEFLPHECGTTTRPRRRVSSRNSCALSIPRCVECPITHNSWRRDDCDSGCVHADFCIYCSWRVYFPPSLLSLACLPFPRFFTQDCSPRAWTGIVCMDIC